MIDRPHNQKLDRQSAASGLQRQDTLLRRSTSDERAALLRLQREISSLKRALAEREHEVWTLKQLLLYR